MDWCGDGFVGLFSKRYYCFGAFDKYSTKDLSKRYNEIDKDAFLDVLTNRRIVYRTNRPLVRVDVRAGTCSAHVLLRETRGARGKVEHRSCEHVMNKKGGPRRSPSNAVMDARWKDPFTCAVDGPTGCGKTIFVTHILCNASTMIESPPEKTTWCYGEWQFAYATMNQLDLQFEEGLIRGRGTSSS